MFLKRCDLKIAGLWLGLLTGFVVLACYLMRPDVVGFLYDDGMYLMVAKALAEGHGYRLMGIVDQPYFYKYPPLFPLMLALGWLINPHFPHNIVWLKSINILLATGTLALWGYYFRTIRQFPQWVCLLLVLILGTHWRFLEVSIDLMSEPLFMLLSTLALILCHRFQEKNPSFTPTQVAVLVVLSVAAFYTRTMALPLITAIGLWLWLSGQRKQAGAYWLSSAILTLPWFLWSGSRRDTTYALGDFLVRTFQETYFQSFRMDLKYEYTLPELVGKGLQDLLGNCSVQFFPLLERFFLNKPTLLSESVILGLSFALIVLLGRYAYQQLKARHFSPEGLYVSVYLAMLPFWSFYKFYPRFILPLLFLLLGFLVNSIAHSKTTASPKTVSKSFWLPWALIGLFGLNLLHLTPYLSKSARKSLIVSTQPDLWQDYQSTFQFIQAHTSANSRFYLENTDENYFYALNTNRSVFDFFVFLPEEKILQHCPKPTKACLENFFEQNAKVTLNVLAQGKVNYIVDCKLQVIKNQYNNWYPAHKAMSMVPLLIQQNPSAFQAVFQTNDGLITIYRYQPSGRPTSSFKNNLTPDRLNRFNTG